jgi:GNAT superfamily N-acetyltransferase
MILRALRDEDDRIRFRSGTPSLDAFLHRHALQNHRLGLSRVYVAVETPESTEILGYYTLGNTSIASDRLAETITQRLPRYPTPAILIRKLAADERHRGRGVGRALLRHALETSIRAAEISAALGVLVDAKEEGVVGFYERFGFVPIPPSAVPQPMFLPMTTLRESLSG